SGTTGTKDCNTCHEDAGAGNGSPPEQLSAPLDPFGTSHQGTDLAPFIICTDEPDKEVKPGEGLTKQCLPEICDCIDNAVNEDGSPLDTDEGRVVLALCRALEDYQSRRGACGSEPCPSPSGPECEDEDQDCSPTTGETVPQTTGYSCQDVGGTLQCVSDRLCGDYTMSGGGKYLLNKAVTMVRVDMTGEVPTSSESTFSDSIDVTGTLSAYNYKTRKQINSVSFSSLKAILSAGGDFSATGRGKALVNNVLTDIVFDATKAGSAYTFSIKDAQTSGFLGGGTGEPGRAAVELTLMRAH
ncbi:MAG: hypothetical protein ACREQY_07325, partial [Candidatus Binatia bacterium]